MNILPIEAEFIFIYFISLYMYINSPDLQQSIEGAIHQKSNQADLLPEMPRYCCLVEIIYFGFIVE